MPCEIDYCTLLLGRGVTALAPGARARERKPVAIAASACDWAMILVSSRSGIEGGFGVRAGLRAF
jgi:hypothetical protein